MIIFLNGASSSGKSSIAKHLQEILDDMYIHIGIDTFISLMPAKSNKLDKPMDEAKAVGFYWQLMEVNGTSAYRIRKGSYAEQINHAYRSTVAHLASLGLNIIVDDVCNGVEEMRIWQKTLQNYDCLYVGVFCSNEELVKREQKRGDRLIGSAIEQSARVHQGITYDIEIDTSLMSIASCAKTVKKYYLSSPPRRTTNSPILNNSG